MSDSGTDEQTQTPELASDHRREAVVERLRSDIGDQLIEFEIDPGVDMWIRVDVEAWADAIASLADRGFDFFVFLSGIDWMPSPWGQSENDPFADEDDDEAAEAAEMKSGRAGGDTRFQVFARLTDLDEHFGVTIKADVPEAMQIPSIIPTFAGANWHEREAHEMFGFDFIGHPDLRNLYLPGDFEGHPLRKDFPLLSRHIKPWPGIVDVEPLPEEDDES